MSPTIFAHVRAAYPGMPVSENNCHPFAAGRYLWMHSECVAYLNHMHLDNCSAATLLCMDHQHQPGVYMCNKRH
eukprot:850722-Pelagomonas_calceolata.AAC.2